MRRWRCTHRLARPTFFPLRGEPASRSHSPRSWFGSTSKRVLPSLETRYFLASGVKYILITTKIDFIFTSQRLWFA
jgi:hypothetical protein